MGAVVAVILWLLDLQLHGQSVSFCTNNVRSNPAHGKVYSILATDRWLYPGLRVPQPKTWPQRYNGNIVESNPNPKLKGNIQQYMIIFHC